MTKRTKLILVALFWAVLIYALAAQHGLAPHPDPGCQLLAQ